jgi:hypothetical protein
MGRPWSAAGSGYRRRRPSRLQPARSRRARPPRRRISGRSRFMNRALARRRAASASRRSPRTQITRRRARSRRASYPSVGPPTQHRGSRRRRRPCQPPLQRPERRHPRPALHSSFRPCSLRHWNRARADHFDETGQRPRPPRLPDIVSPVQAPPASRTHTTVRASTAWPSADPFTTPGRAPEDGGRALRCRALKKQC